MKTRTFGARLVGCALLNSACYEEVEADPRANAQAIGVVVLSTTAAALGSGVRGGADVLGVLVTAGAAWIIWVLLTLLIGTKLLPGERTRADFGQVLRTTGFSAAPGLLRVLGVIPGIGGLIFAASTLWMLATFVVAIRQALDYAGTGRALAVCLLGWAIHAVVILGFVMTAI